jgi:hypothetical protein
MTPPGALLAAPCIGGSGPMKVARVYAKYVASSLASIAFTLKAS